MEGDKETMCHPITTSEAAYLLNQHKNRHKNIRSESYQIFRKTLEYTDTFGKIKDKSVMDDLRATLSDFKYAEDEIAILGSLLPQSIDEAKIYVPSLTRFDDEIIEKAIHIIQLIE